VSDKKKMPQGHRFQKGQSGNPGGRKPKTTAWREAEDVLREALPRLLLMNKNDLRQMLDSNPTGAEMLAAKYIHEHATEAVNRFLGKTPNVLTGAEGKPLIPEPSGPQIDWTKFSEKKLLALIEATK